MPLTTTRPSVSSGSRENALRRIECISDRAMVDSFGSEVFDRVAKDYDEVVPFFATFGRELVGWAGIRAGDQVLDFGAGRGAVTLPALDRVGDHGLVVAIDVAAEMTTRLTASAPDRLRSLVMDAANIELASDSFDHVLCGFALHIMVNPTRVLAEAYRVLRPGGRLTFSVPGPCADGGWWEYYSSIVEEYQRLVTVPAGMTATVPLTNVATRLGFCDAEQVSREIHLPLSGPNAYWSWLLSHGNRWLYDALDSRERNEFRSRVLRGLEHRHPTGGHSLDAGAWFCRMAKPKMS